MSEGGTEKRNVTEILFGYSAEVVMFLFSTQQVDKPGCSYLVMQGV